MTVSPLKLCSLLVKGEERRDEVRGGGEEDAAGERKPRQSGSGLHL